MPFAGRHTIALCAGLALALPPAGLEAQQGVWALTNARIETVTRGTIERGTILVRDGLIAAVGPSVAVPPEARRLDLDGRTVSPGLIDLGSSLGLSSAPAASAPAGGAPRSGGNDPQRRVVDELRITPADAKSARDAGITAVLVAPSRGLFRGQSALVPTRDSADRSTTLRAPVGQHLGYQGVGNGEYPGSLLGVIATQRQMLYDARRYGLIEDRWTSNPRGIARPATDPALAALVPVVRGLQPLFVDARNENEIRRAVRLADEFGLQLVVHGASEAWRATDVLTGHGLAVSVNFPRPTEATGWRYRGALRRTPGDSAAADAAARTQIEGNAAALHRAGLRFALTSGGARSGEFLANARKAVAAGLPASVALEAMTVRAAELAGMSEALGSIETGKIANLVVSTGPLLTDTSRITMVFVDGERHEVAAAATRPAAAGAAANEGGAAAVGGTWTITTNSPQGVMESSLTATQDGASFSGTMVSQMMGTSQVSDGQVSGRRVSWSITMQFGGQAFTLNYAGDVDGTRMSGTVTAGEFGSFPFTGEKRP